MGAGRPIPIFRSLRATRLTHEGSNPVQTATRAYNPRKSVTVSDTGSNVVLFNLRSFLSFYVSKMYGIVVAFL